MKWDEWSDVVARTDTICKLIANEQAPRALMQVLENVYAQYREQLKPTHERLQAEKSPPLAWPMGLPSARCSRVYALT